MSAVTTVVVRLNALANALGNVLLAPVGVLPGWLSASLVAALTGVCLLFVFKHTSNQRAIKRVRDDIKANLLALKLFKDSPLVTLQAQGRVFRGAFLLFAHAIVPMAVMALPVALLLSQLSLWYQARPLRAGESALVEVSFGESPGADLPELSLEPANDFEAAIGPVRVPSERSVYWDLVAKKDGRHILRFRVGDREFEKEFIVGDGLQRVSLERPSRNVSAVLLHPWEPPFEQASPVQAIAVHYPTRASWTNGTDSWVVYWFIVSMLAAFAAKPLMGVNI